MALESIHHPYKPDLEWLSFRRGFADRGVLAVGRRMDIDPTKHQAIDVTTEAQIILESVIRGQS